MLGWAKCSSEIQRSMISLKWREGDDNGGVIQTFKLAIFGYELINVPILGLAKALAMLGQFLACEANT